MKAPWTIAGSILFAAGIGWGAFNVATLLGHDEYTETVVYDRADVASIDVDNGAGGITVIGTDDATASGQITLVADISDGVRATENSHGVVDGAAASPTAAGAARRSVGRRTIGAAASTPPSVSV